MKLSEFDYYIPRNRIAQYPADERDSSRLLVLYRKRGEIEHRMFKDIIDYVQAGDVLVLNNTRVIPARLYGKKASGGKVEVLLIKEYLTNKWQALVRGMYQGSITLKNGISGFISRNNGVATITFHDDIKKSLREIGVMPLPPYIKRPAHKLDDQRYQTVYAEKDGALAAPTAGLHFTKEILDRIEEKGASVIKLTLHVGYGTFKPVVSHEIEQHRMEEEYYEIPENTAHIINHAQNQGKRVIATGTTVTRALETAAMNDGDAKIRSGRGKSELFIYPGYMFQVIDGLITNFHLPKSTPFMLTSAFAGLALLKKTYRDALHRNYRFFSYGDAMLIL
jgi:S-adenosylmethionine:tRNA ribosyltransferase-isomerase